MKKIILALLIGVSVCGLCSCGEESNTIVGTWTTKTFYLDTIHDTYTDDNTISRFVESHDDPTVTTSEKFTWHTYPTYTCTDENGNEITYTPSDEYEGVLVVSDDDNVDSAVYYKFDEYENTMYFINLEDETTEMTYTRE